jgi:hypothetical protein
LNTAWLSLAGQLRSRDAAQQAGNAVVIRLQVHSHVPIRVMRAWPLARLNMRVSASESHTCRSPGRFFLAGPFSGDPHGNAVALI